MIRVYFKDLDNNPVWDPEHVAERTIIRSLESQAPGGYSVARFSATRFDVFEAWAVKESYTVIVMDGLTEIWEGRIEGIGLNRQGAHEDLAIEAVGKAVFLQERLIRARWYHQIPPNAKDGSGFRWPGGLETNVNQLDFVYNATENLVEILGGTRDVSRATNERFRLLYELPVGMGYSQFIKRVEYDWLVRTGEGFDLIIWSIDQAGAEDTVNRISVTPISGTGYGVPFSLGDTTSFEFRIETANDLYDQKDIVNGYNWVIKTLYQTSHSAYGSEAYSQDELAEDVLLMVNAKSTVLSTDFDELGAPTQVIVPFVVERPTPARRAIEDILSFGDGSGNTFLAYVWGSQGTTDDKPKVVIEQWDTSSEDYIISLTDEELAGIRYKLNGSELVNWVMHSFLNKKDVLTYRTPDNNGSLKNDTSIADEYQREYYLSLSSNLVGADADELAIRYLDFHDERIPEGTFSIHGQIQDASGFFVPVSWLRAGDVMRIAQLDRNFKLRHVSYDPERNVATCSLDKRPDGISELLVKLRWQAERAEKEKQR